MSTIDLDQTVGRRNLYFLEMDRRYDIRTALFIDVTLQAVAEQRQAEPERALVDYGVKGKVIVRVLTRPRERRCFSDSVAAFTAA